MREWGKRERDRKGERVREREKRERKRFEKLNSVSETKSNQIDAHSESVRIPKIYDL